MDLKELSEKAKVMAEVFQYLAMTGIILLQQEKPLTFEEWKALFGKAQQALLESNYSAATSDFFEAVMERGIKDAARLIPDENVSAEEFEQFRLGFRSNESDFAQWTRAYLLRFMGFERIPDVQRRARLVNLLLEEIAVPLMKRTGGKLGKSLIDQAAGARFYNDHDAKVPFESYWEAKWNN